LGQGEMGTAVHRALVADMGDYPSLYPALVGTWWWGVGGGQPGRLPVRLFLLLSPLLAAGAVYSLARSAGRGPALVAAGCVLHLPLVAGISRHFMPEALLIATVALAVAAADRHRSRPSPGSAALLGLALACGLLTKQTFVFFLLPVLFQVRPHRTLVWALPTGALALPWALNNLAEQFPYLSGSAGSGDGVGLLGHVLFYPRSLLQPGLGWVWLLLVVGAGACAWQSRHRRLVILGLLWLLGSAALLTLVPKKYDRLLAPALPGAALVLAAGIAARPKFAWLPVAGVAWTAWMSHWDTPFSSPPGATESFHSGCTQVWVRAPVTADPGFEGIVDEVRIRNPSRVVVMNAPEIPCVLQTTFDWGAHLGPYLRRAGVDRELEHDVTPTTGDLVVDFRDNEIGTSHPLPLLNTEFRTWSP